MKVELTKVDNGWILQISKLDFVTKQVESSTFVFPSLEEALAKIKAA